MTLPRRLDEQSAMRIQNRGREDRVSDTTTYDDMVCSGSWQYTTRETGFETEDDDDDDGTGLVVEDPMESDLTMSREMSGWGRGGGITWMQLGQPGLLGERLALGP